MTLLAAGHTLIEKPNGDRVTHLPDGVRVFEKAEGQTVELQPKLPRHKRPLNVASTSGEEIGRLISNFAPTPFVLGGRGFSCVEAFYVFLKFADDPEKQKAIPRHDRQRRQTYGRRARVTGVNL